MSREIDPALSELVSRYREDGVAEKLVGRDFNLYDRETGRVPRILRVLDITEKNSLRAARLGPTLLCYGEDSTGVFVQFRRAYPDGSPMLRYHYPVRMLEEDESVRSEFEREVEPEEREGFADFVVGYAPDPIGEAIGRPLTNND